MITLSAILILLACSNDTWKQGQVENAKVQKQKYRDQSMEVTRKATGQGLVPHWLMTVSKGCENQNLVVVVQTSSMVFNASLVYSDKT